MASSSTISRNQPSCVENVPDEIWTEIILNTRHIPTTHNVRDRRELSRARRNMFSVSQICSRLRAITLETPSLWTWIFVDFRSFTPSLDLHLTRLALQRSGTLPLSVFLLDIFEPEPEHGSKYQNLVAVLSQIPRWKDAFLSWRARYSQFWTSMGPLIDSAPLLESLIMDAKPDEAVLGYGLLPSKLWEASPRLQKLEVTMDIVLEDTYGLVPSFPPPPMGLAHWETSNNIPFTQLTHLRLFVLAYETVSNEELICIFSCSPNLISCFIESADNAKPSLNCADPILLPHLRHLYLENRNTDGFFLQAPLAGILDIITAPSLVTLTLVNEKSSNLQAYKNFIVRSSCQLEELNRVNTVCSKTSENVTWMELSPSLRAVHFHNMIIDEPFLKIWTGWDAMEGAYTVCPNLERLSVTSSSLLSLKKISATPLRPGQLLLARLRPPDGGSKTLATLFMPSEQIPVTCPSPGLAQALLPRLHPPAGGSKIFTTLLIPAENNGDVHSEIRALCDEPYGLKIGFNDDMLKRGAFWDLYADR